MKRISFILLSFLFFSTSWSCCPPNSVNPLSDFKTADYEDRLEGTWYGKSETNTDVFLHIGKRKDNGTTQVISVEYKKNGSLDLVKIELIIKNGALKGSIPKERKITGNKGDITKLIPSTGCVKITDSSQNIVKYFESMDTERLFPYSLKFKKMI